MKKVQIYTVDYCPYCFKAKDLLAEMNIPYTEIDITENETEYRNKLGDYYKIEGQVTVPQIIIGEERIGGFDSLKDLIKNKKIDTMLQE